MFRGVLPRLASPAKGVTRATRHIPLSTSWIRRASTKHPKGFNPPNDEDLLELRERVQEFTRREIPEDVAAKTDRDNEFPGAMWKKLGDAGYD